jgi:hypothetical protein
MRSHLMLATVVALASHNRPVLALCPAREDQDQDVDANRTIESA